jgi:3-hydroxybutyryl-CoA dehydrogenase
MSIQKIGIAGVGLLGRGIAATHLAHGFRVVVFDPSTDSLHAARHHIAQALEDLVRRGGFPESLLTDWSARYIVATSLTDFAPCDFVYESVVEDLRVKQSVYDQLEAIVRPAVPIASNTSALPISVLQRNRKHPARFVGSHWCTPCHVTRFLEIIKGEQTDDATVEAAMALGRACGKDPSLVRKDIDGFIVNRMAYAIFREAFHLLESGVADVATIDSAFRNVMGIWAPTCGPFRWMDLTGLPAYASVMKRLFPTLSNETDVPSTMQRLVDSGATGSQNGRGFYTYTPEEAARWEALIIEHVWKLRDLSSRMD